MSRRIKVIIMLYPLEILLKHCVIRSSWTLQFFLLGVYPQLSLCTILLKGIKGSKGGALVRVLPSHQCGPGSNPGVDAICGLSMLLVLSLAQRGCSPSTLVFSLSLKTNTFKFQFDLARTDTFQQVLMNSLVLHG